MDYQLLETEERRNLQAANESNELYLDANSATF
jgi:hypothetical protein